MATSQLVLLHESGYSKQTVTQVNSTLTISGGTQVVTAGGATVNASVTQVYTSVSITPNTQASSRLVTVSQVAASITLTGGTQVVASTRLANVSQLAANITLLGGGQFVSTVENSSIIQAAGTLQLTGGEQAVNSQEQVSISQTFAGIILTGGAQGAQGISTHSSSLSQESVELKITTGTQIINQPVVARIKINWVTNYKPYIRLSDRIIMIDNDISYKISEDNYISTRR
jgi:hypothetical protein